MTFVTIKSRAVDHLLSTVNFDAIRRLLILLRILPCRFSSPGPRFALVHIDFRNCRAAKTGALAVYIRLFFAYNGTVTSRRCTVSFTDSNSITHTAHVSAASLFEAAALGVAEFRRCGFAEVAVGVGTTLDITVRSPSTTHSLRVSRLEAWLNSSGKSPAEQALKVRLKNEIARVG